ncbi:Transcriptional regulator [Seminavis robusta]|uniref:Transcriptional regulator n=1 Tax=Seminavis robusta TaxID=568900 RepID=A0A9N8EE29_9STRA|nr:Transcriptional regulator [Seminavis robusta]|eukprot:Sro1043_g234840.1 Transcriptional regulator (1150) ;mRNA; f:26241-29906
MSNPQGSVTTSTASDSCISSLASSVHSGRIVVGTSTGRDTGSPSSSNRSGSFGIPMTKIKRDSYSTEFRECLVETDSQNKARLSRGRSTLRLTSLRHDKVGYYGRQKQEQLLQESVERLCFNLNPKDPCGTTSAGTPGPTPKCELVLVGGTSGTGKTALAKQVETKLPKGACFIMGKCDLNASDEPYSAISDACETLCEHLLNKSAPDQGQLASKAREMLLDQLGLQVMGHLWGLIPSLYKLVAETHTQANPNDSDYDDKDKEMPHSVIQEVKFENETLSSGESSMGATAKRQQMNYAFRVLIRVFSSCYRPLVICIDDLQWSDSATLELIELLLTDVEHNRLLIIGCYRSEHVQDDDQLSQAIQKFQGLKPTVQVSEIELQNLSVQDCASILVDLLSMQGDEDKIEELAAVCHKRTMGNVNFLLQFTTMLHETRLIDYHLGLMRWVWDSQHIETETDAADNVIVVLEKRMDQLDQELRHFLSVASSIGATSSLRILELAWDTAKKLNPAKDETSDFSACIDSSVFGNFIELCGDDKYKFVHDKIQEAAAGLWSQEERQKEQVAIGMRLLSELTVDEQHAHVFLIRDLLDKNQHPNAVEAETIVRINWMASERARSLSAFKSSLVYAKKGISLLTPNAWETNYATALALYTLASEAAGFLGHKVLMEELSETVLNRPECPLLDKVRIYTAKIDTMANEGSPESVQNAIDLIVDLLNQLGCKVPKMLTLSVISTMFHFKKNVPTEGELRALPRLSDREKMEAMHLLYRLQGYGYITRQIMLSLWAAFKVGKITLKDGRHPVSSLSFPCVGFAMTSLFSDFQKGELYAKHAEALIDMEEDKSKEGRMTVSCLPSFVYTRPVQSVGKKLIQGYKTDMQAGDSESAMYCLSHHCYMGFLTSRSLDYLEADCHKFLAQASQLQIFNAIFFLAPLAELVSALTGSRLGIETYLDGKSSPMFTDHLDLFHTVSHAYLGRYQEAADLFIRRGNAYDGVYPAMPIRTWDKFLAGVCLYDAARSTGRRKYLKQANIVRKTIHSWLKKGNPNANHHACLLDAEYYRLRKKTAKASKFYENAAIMAGRAGLLHDAAFTEERYAYHLMESSALSKEEAGYRLKKAVMLYTEWGASEKVRLLEDRFPEFLRRDGVSAPFRTME